MAPGLVRLVFGVALTALLAWSVASAAALWFAAQAGALADGPSADPQRALGPLQTARRFAPRSPELLIAEGQLLERQASQADASVAAGRLAGAQQRYREAIARQPTSAFANAALLRVLLKSQAPAVEIDAQFARTVRLGRWEPGVQRSLIETGLAAWPVLTSAQQDHLIDVLVAGLTSQPDWVMAAVVRAGRWDALGPVIERLAADDPGLSALFKRYAPATR